MKSNCLCFLIDTWGSHRMGILSVCILEGGIWICQSPALLCGPLYHTQDFEVVTPWLAYCLLSNATYHTRIAWLSMPFGQSQGHHLLLEEWSTILFDLPLVLLCPRYVYYVRAFSCLAYTEVLAWTGGDIPQIQKPVIGKLYHPIYANCHYCAFPM